MAKRMLCRVGWHRWERKFTEDRESYWACRHCDTVNNHTVGSADHFVPPGGG